MSERAMRRSVADGRGQTEPKSGLGPLWDRQNAELDEPQESDETEAARLFAENCDIVYGSAQRAVLVGWTKQSAFADDMGMSESEVSLCLRRAPNGKGVIQRATLDVIAKLRERPAALKAFLDDNAAPTFRLEPVDQPPPEVQLASLKAALARAGKAGQAVMDDAADIGGFNPAVLRKP